MRYTRSFALLAPVLSMGLALLGGCGSGGSSPTASSTTAATTSTTTNPVPSAATPPPAPKARTTTVSGWLPYWTRTQGDVTIDAYAGIGLDEVNLFGIGLDPDGTLAKVSGIEDPARVAIIHAKGGEVIPTIYDVHDSTALAAVLSSPSARARAIQSMLDLLDGGDYDGIDLDFEHAKTSNRDEFSRFVADLGAQVKARGKVFSVTVPGKRLGSRSWGGYDYAALGAAADRFKIMTYGYSGKWKLYPGGPIAPTDWIEKVLDYAVTLVDRDKIQIGIPFYGYDWPSDGSTIRSVTSIRARTLLATTGATATFDASRGESTFTYTENGVDHVVWFQGARSIEAKAALVDRYQVRGLAVWALGYGDAPEWNAIRSVLIK
ncbi:MAG: hypothetical protein JKY65_26475 [Planctomycetes bacterium]|nr:hypothetical protein [Planctomycetota bacterium]